MVEEHLATAATSPESVLEVVDAFLGSGREGLADLILAKLDDEPETRSGEMLWRMALSAALQEDILGAREALEREAPAEAGRAAGQGSESLAEAREALESLVAEHERDKVELQAERDYIPRIFCHADAALAKTGTVLAGLTVRADNMRRNLDASGGLILSEAIMMRLSPVLGRQRAHGPTGH